MHTSYSEKMMCYDDVFWGIYRVVSDESSGITLAISVLRPLRSWYSSASVLAGNAEQSSRALASNCETRVDRAALELYIVYLALPSTRQKWDCSSIGLGLMDAIASCL